MYEPVYHKQRRCWNCGLDYLPSRSDQIFCCKKCRDKYNYIPVPQCKECSNEKCELRNNNRKYAPKNCPGRV